MGGCRCTYRSCTSRTDGKIHLFHYPVFDKARCRQWLLNAQRLEFLSLTVAQLKNRVICQHHFKDEMFMNLKKDKLKHDALPTEDGPYCKYTIKDDNGECVPDLALENIEVENIITSGEKVAHFPVKYVDFLTNSDNLYLELTPIGIEFDPLNKRTITTYDKDILIDTDVKDNINNLQDTEIINIENNVQPLKVCPEVFVVPKVNVNQHELASNKSNTADIKENKRVNKNSNVLTQKKSRVKIISEKKISEPVPINTPVQIIPINTCKFVNVTPSFVLTLPDKTKLHSKEKCKKETNKITSQIHDAEQKICDKETTFNTSERASLVINTNKNIGKVKTSKLLKMKKISPERLAAIEEKRKFNMKLRDLIESGFNNKVENSYIDVTERHIISKDSSRVKSKEISLILPKENTYTGDSLESRIERLESNLTSQIDKNARQIEDLTKLFMRTTSCKTKKTKSTQTILSEESKKKYLFNELSEYLSSELSSLLYTELFLNRYGSDMQKKKQVVLPYHIEHPPKRKKY